VLTPTKWFDTLAGKADTLAEKTKHTQVFLDDNAVKAIKKATHLSCFFLLIPSQRLPPLAQLLYKCSKIFYD